MRLSFIGSTYFFYRQHVIKPALIGLIGAWISGGAEFNWPLHHRPSTFMPVDYTIEEKTKTVALTEEGNIRVEKLLNAGNLYDPANVDLVHHVHQALKAHALFHRDVDYVVKDDQVMIVETRPLSRNKNWRVRKVIKGAALPGGAL
jgi:hypothetical protein